MVNAELESRTNWIQQEQNFNRKNNFVQNQPNVNSDNNLIGAEYDLYSNCYLYDLCSNRYFCPNYGKASFQNNTGQT